MRKRTIAGCLALLLTAVMAWGTQAANVQSVSPGEGGTSDTDPDCSSAGTECGWITVVLPAGSQVDGVTAAASNDGQNFLDCPAVPHGAKYSYMDCTAMRVRYLNSQPQIVVTSSSVQVNWQLVNWNTHRVWGKLVVNYR